MKAHSSIRGSATYFGCVAIVLTSHAAVARDSVPTKGPNPKAVADAEAGRLETADASWWGFSKEDSTKYLQRAIDAGTRKLIVPFMGDPWIITPVKLRSDLEIVFEPGVLVLAKKDEFRGQGDSLFSLVDASNVTIRGYGATLRMRKADYLKEPYKKAEWRMGIRMIGCRNVLIEGVRIESSGGDGIYIGETRDNLACVDVTIRDVVCYDNHRQGISVISAENLLIENTAMSNTWGTAPSAGIDFEPDSPRLRLVNCVVRNCVFENNAGHAILVYLRNMKKHSQPVSVRFENCVSRMGFTAGLDMDDFQDMSMLGWGGMTVGAAADEGPSGLVEFINCTSENTGKESAKVFDMSLNRVKVRFVDCSWKNPWVSAFRDYAGPRVPILIELRRPTVIANEWEENAGKEVPFATSAGNVEFIDCHVFDTVYRPVVQFIEPNAGEFGVQDLSGDITLHTPQKPKEKDLMKLGPKTSNISLKVTVAGTTAPLVPRKPDADAE